MKNKTENRKRRSVSKDKIMLYASYLLLYSNNKMSHQEQKPAISTIKYMKSVREMRKGYLSFRICVIIHNKTVHSIQTASIKN